MKTKIPTKNKKNSFKCLIFKTIALYQTQSAGYVYRVYNSYGMKVNFDLLSLIYLLIRHLP